MGQPSKERKLAWLAKNKHKRPLINRNWKLRNVYGITPERFDEMYSEQEGRCGICQRPISWEPSGDSTGLHIDHDHSTLYVRGLLCINCNSGIGQFGDSIEALKRAVEYLERTTTPSDFVFSKVPNPKRKSNTSTERTAEWRKNMSEARKGKEPWNKGKEWSDETKKKMSEAAKKRGLTEEGKAHRARLAELARKG